MNDAGYPCIWCNAYRYNLCDGNEHCVPYQKWSEYARKELKKWRYLYGH